MSHQIDLRGDGILGRDFLKGMQAHICYKEMLLTLQYKSTTVRKKLGPLPELKSKNFLDRGVNKLTLPARAEVIVQLPVTEESSVKEAGDFSFR